MCDGFGRIQGGAQLTRLVSLGKDAATWEVSGSFQPLVAFSVLAAWAIFGFLLAVMVVKRDFLQQSLSTLEKARSKLMNQVGI